MLPASIQRGDAFLLVNDAGTAFGVVLAVERDLPTAWVELQSGLTGSVRLDVIAAGRQRLAQYDWRKWQ